ncbi:MAG: hypothetical protein WC992_00015 [Acholeplasmataceae bacterium]|jgi:hypothetical protein
MNGDLSIDQKRLLVIYYALDETVQRRVAGHAAEEVLSGWNPASEMPYRLAWEAIQGVLAASGAFGPLDVDMWWAQLGRLPVAQQASQLPHSPVFQELGVLYTMLRRRYDSVRMQSHSNYVLQLFQEFLEYRVVMQLARRESRGDLFQDVSDLHSRLIQARPASVEPVRFMMPGTKLPSANFRREPFGIDWLDRMTGGGMALGDAMLFLAPSGGGKTVLGSQCSWARCLQCQPSAYFSYEQEILGDIMIRFLAMATGISRKEFEGREPEEYPLEALERLEEVRERCGRYLLPYDMSTGAAGTGGINEIAACVQALSREGNRPTLVVIDWVQTCVVRNMAARGIPGTQLTGEMDRFASEFARFCRDEKVQGIMLQQLDTENQRKKGIEPHHTMAAYCKSMGNYCRYAIGIAALDDQMIGTMTRSKATSVAQNENNKIIVRLHGDLNQFRTAAGYQLDARSGMYAQAGPSAGRLHAT